MRASEVLLVTGPLSPQVVGSGGHLPESSDRGDDTREHSRTAVGKLRPQPSSIVGDVQDQKVLTGEILFEITIII